MKDEFVVKIEKHKKMLLTAEEWQVYLFIEALGGFVWTPSHLPQSQGTKMAKIIFGEKNEYYRALQDANIQKLSSFGVDPNSANDPVNGDFCKWYDFWHEWYQSLSENQLVRFHENAKIGLSVEELLPDMRWNELEFLSAV